MKEIKSNGLGNIISQAIEEMKSEQGDHFSLEKNNLAELERRTGISRAKMRRFKKNGFVFKPHGLEGRKAPRTILTGYTAILETCSGTESPTPQSAWNGYGPLDFQAD